MYSASASGVLAGMRTPYSRPRSSSVAGRTDPSRWQCSSAFGSRRSSSWSMTTLTSELLRFGHGIAQRAGGDQAIDGAAVHGRRRIGGEPAAVGDDAAPGAHVVGGG